MKVTAIAPWFGSKRAMAPTIAEQLGPHRAYLEPFCGGTRTARFAVCYSAGSVARQWSPLWIERCYSFPFP